MTSAALVEEEEVEVDNVDDAVGCRLKVTTSPASFFSSVLVCVVFYSSQLQPRQICNVFTSACCAKIFCCCFLM